MEEFGPALSTYLGMSPVRLVQEQGVPFAVSIKTVPMADGAGTDDRR